MRGAFGGFADHVWEELDDLKFAGPDTKYNRGTRGDIVVAGNKETYRELLEDQCGPVGCTKAQQKAIRASVPPYKKPAQPRRSTKRRDSDVEKDKAAEIKRSVSPTAGKPNPKDSISQTVDVRLSEFDDCPDGYYFCTKAMQCMPIPKGQSIAEDGMRIERAG